jgi:hypothetical protein
VIFGNNAKLGDKSTSQSIAILNKDWARLKAMHRQKIR